MNYSSAKRSESRRRKRSKIRKFVIVLQVMILLGISASLGAGLAMFVGLSSELPEVNDVEAPEASIIYSSDGVILARIFHEDRTSVPLKDIPADLRNATIAIEDSRFYRHSGIDVKGIARATWANLRHHGMVEGGSTITQQLARNVFLTQRKTVERKAQEAVLAILMERHYTKDKILELYLNRVYYGSGAFGVQAASKVYFRKNVNQLDLSQAAMLAGMPKGPSIYSPHEDKEKATKRRNIVLAKMAELGYITEQQRDEAMNKSLDIAPRAKGRSTFKAPYFVDYVTKQLRDRYGDDILFSGGLRVYTTLNYKMQEAAEEALIKGITKYKSMHVTQGCFVAVEPGTGYIRAMVGSVDPNSQFNRCVQGAGQQPGSSFKLFVYTAGFEKGGMSPTTRIENTRKSWPMGDGRSWTPANYDGKYSGAVTIKEAIKRSINLPAIRVADKVGIQNVIHYARLLGIKTELQPYLSTAIGASEVHPLDLASAYGTYANNGVHVEPISVIKITDNQGEAVKDFVPSAKKVVSDHTVRMMDECLRAVVVESYGTGKKVMSVPEARGKTGTTNDNRDVWFAGYVPHKLAAVVWAGNDDNSSMKGAVTGGGVCGPVWRDFMLKAIPIYDNIEKERKRRNEGRTAAVKNTEEQTNKPAQDKPQLRERREDESTNSKPDMVEYAVCDESGLLATESCPSHIESFTRGSQPKSYCSAHSNPRGKQISEGSSTTEPKPVTNDQDATLVTVTVCPETGLLAGPDCPNRTRKRFKIDDVPTQVCNVHGRN